MKNYYCNFIVNAKRTEYKRKNTIHNASYVILTGTSDSCICTMVTVVIHCMCTVCKVRFSSNTMNIIHHNCSSSFSKVGTAKGSSYVGTVTVQLINLSLPESYPNCLHTTLASVESHESSQTVPHLPLWHSSTLPSVEFDPSTRRTIPIVQTEVINTSLNNTN